MGCIVNGQGRLLVFLSFLVSEVRNLQTAIARNGHAVAARAVVVFFLLRPGEMADADFGYVADSICTMFSQLIWCLFQVGSGVGKCWPQGPLCQIFSAKQAALFDRLGDARMVLCCLEGLECQSLIIFRLQCRGQ